MSERWLPIPGWDGVYDVSDHGRVRSRARFVDAKLGSKRWQSERVLSPGRMPHGHLTVRLCRNATGKSHAVHRLVLLAFVGPGPDGTECCHNNGDPADNRLSNLRWDTRIENQRDRVRHGTHYNSNKTHCKHGHPLIESNLYRYGRKRACKTCVNNRATERYYAANKQQQEMSV